MTRNPIHRLTAFEVQRRLHPQPRADFSRLSRFLMAQEKARTEAKA